MSTVWSQFRPNILLGLIWGQTVCKGNQMIQAGKELTLKAPITTKVVCFSRLLKCLRSLYEKQCGPRSDCSYKSSLFWVHAVCFSTYFVSNIRQLFAADGFSRRHYQMHFFLGALRVKVICFISFSGAILKDECWEYRFIWYASF